MLSVMCRAGFKAAIHFATSAIGLICDLLQPILMMWSSILFTAFFVTIAINILVTATTEYETADDIDEQVNEIDIVRQRRFAFQSMNLNLRLSYCGHICRLYFIHWATSNPKINSPTYGCNCRGTTAEYTGSFNQTTEAATRQVSIMETTQATKEQNKLENVKKFHLRRHIWSYAGTGGIAGRLECYHTCSIYVMTKKTSSPRSRPSGASGICKCRASSSSSFHRIW